MAKSLNEQVKEIVDSKVSMIQKQKSLIELGLTKQDLFIILKKVSRESSQPGFRVNNLTFGVEIECYNFTRDALINAAQAKRIDVRSEGYNHTDHKTHFKIVNDASICGTNGNEVVSPILKGKKGENALKKVCDALNEVDARVNRSTGLHVHFDARNLSKEHYVNIFVNYQKIERAIDSFMPESRRRNSNVYCHSLIGRNFEICTTHEDIDNALNYDRYFKVNARAFASHGTIEFRQHSGTVDFTKIANWINFLRRLIEYSFDHRLTDDVNTIDEIPFLSEAEKQYFNNRKEALSAQ